MALQPIHENIQITLGHNGDGARPLCLKKGRYTFCVIWNVFICRKSTNDFDSLKVGKDCLLSVITLNVFTPMKLSYAWYYSICYKGGLNREGGLIYFLVQKGGLIGEGGLIERGLKREFTVLKNIVLFRRSSSKRSRKRVIYWMLYFIIKSLCKL